MSEIDAVVAGHLCLDINPDLSEFEPGKFLDFLSPGRLINTGKVSFSTGGTVSNTGLALHKLGVNCRLVGKVGADIFGQAVEKIIEENGQTLSQSIVKGEEGTSYTIVLNPPGIDRIFLYHPATNDTFTSADIDYGLVRKAKLFHFGYPPLMKMMFLENGRYLVEVVRLARETGATVTLDMALPDPNAPSGKVDWIQVLDGVLPYVDIFLPSIEEITFMLRRDFYEDWEARGLKGDISMLVSSENLNILSSYILMKGVKIVVLKLGEHGLYVRTACRDNLAKMGKAVPSDLSKWECTEIRSSCYKVNALGTVGSGDATIAGFLAGLLKNFSVELAVNMAVAVGACSVEASDALSGIRTWAETEQRIRHGWTKRELNLLDEWNYLPNLQLYKRKVRCTR